MSDAFDNWLDTEPESCRYCGREGHMTEACPVGWTEAAERRAEAEREDPPDPRTWEYWEAKL